MLQYDVKPTPKFGERVVSPVNSNSKLKEAANRAREVLSATDAAIIDANTEQEETEIERMGREAREKYLSHLKTSSRADMSTSRNQEREGVDIMSLLAGICSC